MNYKEMTDAPTPINLRVETHGEALHIIAGDNETEIILSPETAQALGVMLIQKASAIITRRS